MFQGINDDRFRRVLRTYIRNVYDYHRQKLYDVFAYDYTDWDRPILPLTSEPSSSLLETAIEFLGDGQYVAPTVELARAHAAPYNSAPTYVYCFGSRPQDATGGAAAMPGTAVPGQGQSLSWPGHGDDLPYVFGAPLVDGVDPFTSAYSRSDKMLADTVLKYWTNFIKYGSVLVQLLCFIRRTVQQVTPRDINSEILLTENKRKCVLSRSD
jgi:neuroligin